MKWQTTAPSNIALIKYMGKTNHDVNLPSNASISYTLDELLTYIELELSDTSSDSWQPLQQANIETINLSQHGQQRFLKHLAVLKQHFNYSGNFIVRSGNNFPSDCGLASSASSFAALTKCAVQALCELTQQAAPSIEEQAMLSRQGSGSSCRSFFSPWSVWDATGAHAVTLPLQHLEHQVVIIAAGQKKISSSQAHKMVTSSDLFPGRTERATQRLQDLLENLNSDGWPRAYEIVWQEFWDMHALFETATPPFGYMTADSIAVINVARDYWDKHQDGPLVTMDAGPNVHLLYRPEQTSCMQEISNLMTKRGYHVR